MSAPNVRQRAGGQVQRRNGARLDLPSRLTAAHAASGPTGGYLVLLRPWDSIRPAEGKGTPKGPRLPSGAGAGWSEKLDLGLYGLTIGNYCTKLEQAKLLIGEPPSIAEMQQAGKEGLAALERYVAVLRAKPDVLLETGGTKTVRDAAVDLVTVDMTGCSAEDRTRIRTVLSNLPARPNP